MLFNSIQYLLFLPIVFFLYYTINEKYKNIFLLISSYIFYISWIPEYIFLIIFSTITDYFVGIKIYNSHSFFLKKIYLSLSLFINLGILFFYKYYNFVIENINFLSQQISEDIIFNTKNIILPLGISFYTFQTISYSFDVFYRKTKPIYNFIDFSLYVSFFPQLIAGPIERIQNIIPQIKKKRFFNYNKSVYGIRLIFLGLFKKVVIADRLNYYVSYIYNEPDKYTGIPVYLATFLFCIQLYCDFSGYSDIAIGSAKLFNIDLMINFNSPFCSKSIREFWQRWHISLSTWLKDYLYIPLAFNLRYIKYFGIPISIFITFFISGLWHGASWKFVLMGLCHAIYIILEYLTEKFFNKFITIKNKIIIRIRDFFRILLTFNLFLFSMIFFRANNIKDSILLAKGIFKDLNYQFTDLNYFITCIKILNFNIIDSIYIIFLILILFLVQYLNFIKIDLNSTFNKLPIIFRYAFYFSFIFLILSTGIFNENKFIYFEF